MSMEIESLILEELKSLSATTADTNQRVAKLEAQIIADAGARLTKLETEMHPLVGNGQPGLISKMDSRVKELEQWRVGLSWWIAGATTIATIVGAAIGGVITWTFEYFKIHK